MARSFSAGNLLTRTSPGDVGNAGSVFVRFKPTWNSGDSASHSIFRYYTASPVAVFDLNQEGDNNSRIGFYSGGTDYRIVVSSAGLFVSGAWANWLITWDTGTGVTNAYKDNSLAGTVTNALSVPTGMDRITLGAWYDGASHSAPADGDMAEFARWDHVLDSTERATLQSTGNPACVPTGLLHHYKILGDDSPEPDEVGSEDLTLVGTPAQATHPTVGGCSSGSPRYGDHHHVLAM